MCRAFVAFTTPVPDTDLVLFETWATDADTFSTTPTWPDGPSTRRFQASRLAASKGGGIDVPCNPPQGAATAGFPTHGTPTPCIAEEVRRNKVEFDYIVENELNTQTGLAAAYAAGLDVQMPTDAISFKGDWVPVQTMIAWIPSLTSPEQVRELYYTHTQDSGPAAGEYALVSVHVSSRQNPNWVWGTFEHELNPGRCDDIGCYDTFGATRAEVPPDHATINTQYGACEKSPALARLMGEARVSLVWQHYCLKSTQVDYMGEDGLPSVLGNSVIERITGNGTVAASSCIACHQYASYGADGAVPPAALAILPYNPTGNPIPAVLTDARKFDFTWGVLNAPK